MKLERLLTIVAAAGALLASRSAAAYVRFMTDDSAPFIWAQAEVPITVYPDDFVQSTMTRAQIANAVAESAAAWNKEQNPCTYLELNASLSDMPTPLAIDDGHNSVIFRSTVWCHVATNGQCDIQYDASLLALTTDTANTTTGQIFDSDVEVNAVDFQWADVIEDPSLDSDMDFQNALTHEFGHLIGLAHTCFNPLTSTTGVPPDDNTGQPIPDCTVASAAVQATTMFPSATPGDTQKRTLAPDDLSALCTIYSIDHPPPGPGATVTGGISCDLGGGSAAAGASGALAVLVIAVRRRRAPSRTKRAGITRLISAARTSSA